MRITKKFEGLIYYKFNHHRNMLKKKVSAHLENLDGGNNDIQLLGEKANGIVAKIIAAYKL